MLPKIFKVRDRKIPTVVLLEVLKTEAADPRLSLCICLLNCTESHNTALSIVFQ